MAESLPPLIFGLVLLAYWGRVVRMAYKARRRTGRTANFLPPERLGRLLRLLWIPVVLIWIAHPWLTLRAADAAWPPLRPLYDLPAIGMIAAAGGVAALVATMICWKKMGRTWRMGIDPQEKTQLIVNGPYGYVRHPIYALSSVLMLATLAAIPSPLMLITGAIHLLLLQWEARREEQYLIDRHGQRYCDYAARVGRFIPLPMLSRSATPHP